MVTVELAVGLITCVLLLGTLAGVVTLGVAQSAIQTASSDLARSIARDDEAMADQVRELSPDDAVFTIDRQPAGVRVTTTWQFPVFRLGQIPLQASAWAPWEPGVEP